MAQFDPDIKKDQGCIERRAGAAGRKDHRDRYCLCFVLDEDDVVNTT
jgi:hypothetical protein